MKSLHTRALIWAAGLTALSACRSTDANKDPEIVESPGLVAIDGADAEEASALLDNLDRLNGTAIPMVTDGSLDSTFDYLLARYDGDGDGKLALAEYSRKENQFERWDSDGDGFVTDADFRRSATRGTGGNRQPMEVMMARRLVARYFQNDDDAGLTTLEEAQQVLANVYDGSGGEAKDGKVSEAEFRCAMEERHQRVPGDDRDSVNAAMGDLDAWEGIARIVDEDQNGALSGEELAAYFGVLGTQTIDYSDWDQPSESTRRPDPGARRPNGGDSSVPEAGETAPDFTLTSPDGQTTATLSDFAGVKPVALIFGSYT